MRRNMTVEEAVIPAQHQWLQIRRLQYHVNSNQSGGSNASAHTEITVADSRERCKHIIEADQLHISCGIKNTLQNRSTIDKI